MEDKLYEALEILNKEKATLLNDKKYKFVKAIYDFKSLFLKFDVKAIIKKIREKKIKGTVKKKYFHPECLSCKENNVDYKKVKIAVYTCIIGEYDNLQIPLLEFNNVDYYLFTDNVEKYAKYSNIYKIIKIDDEVLKLGNIAANRYIKFHPKEILKEYEYTIYIDGNVRIVSDIRTFVKKCNDRTGIAMHTHRERNDIYDEAAVCKLLKRGNSKMIDTQVSKYIEEGFPKKYGMNEATIIVSDINNKISEKLLNDWYEEFIRSKSLRDQLAWPYILWKNNYKISDIGVLGNNIYENYKIEIVRHI